MRMSVQGEAAVYVTKSSTSFNVLLFRFVIVSSLHEAHASGCTVTPTTVNLNLSWESLIPGVKYIVLMRNEDMKMQSLY